jgi:hypothetical protein
MHLSLNCTFPIKNKVSVQHLTNRTCAFAASNSKKRHVDSIINTQLRGKLKYLLNIVLDGVTIGYEIQIH